MLAWYGNHLADEAAGWAASRFSVPPEVALAVGALDERVRLVQLRLAACILSLPPDGPPGGARLETRQDARSKMVGPTMVGQAEQEQVQEQPPPPPARHHTHRSGVLSWCLLCRRGVLAPASLPADCIAENGMATFSGDASTVHPSHLCIVVRGVLVCTRCGRWAKHCVGEGLRGVCGHPTRAGQSALRALAEGRPLDHRMGPWPRPV